MPVPPDRSLRIRNLRVLAAGRWPRLGGELAWVAFGQAMLFAGGLATVKLLAVLLGPAEYGRFALGLSIAGLCNLFVQGPLAQAVLRFLSICRERGCLPQYFAVLDGLFARVAAGNLALAAASWLLLRPFASDNWGATVAFALAFGAVMGQFGYLLATLTAARLRKSAALLQAFDACLKPALAAVVAQAVGGTAVAALAGFCAATAVAVAIAWRRGHPDRAVLDAAGAAGAADAADAADAAGAMTAGPGGGPHPDAPPPQALRREMLAYSTSIMAFSGFAGVAMYADRWILLGTSGAHDVGVYALMTQLASVPFTALVTVATQMVMPVLFQRVGAGTLPLALEAADRLLRFTVMAAGAVMLAAVGCAALFAGPLLDVVATPAFAARAALLWPIMLALAAFQLGQLLTLAGMVLNRPRAYFWPKALQAASLVLIGLPLTRNAGLEGLVVALNASSFLYLAAVLMANRLLQRAARSELPRS